MHRECSWVLMACFRLNRESMRPLPLPERSVPLTSAEILRRILKMTQGMTATNQSSERRLTCKWLCLLRASLRPRQIHACPPESAGAAEPERRCAPLGQRRHKETGREGMRFLATQSLFSPGTASLPWSIPPSCLVIISFYSFLKQVAPFYPTFHFTIPCASVRLLLQSKFAFSPLSPRDEKVCLIRLIVSFEMLHSSCLLSTLF